MPSPDLPQPPPQSGAPQIAVVEDDPIMGESIVQRLTLEGYEAVWWQSGREALAGVKRRRPDLMVCDLRLPDISGEEVFRDALADLRTSPVLFITAFADIDQAVRLIRAGADDYLTKPFAMEEFLRRIDHLLHARRPLPADEAGALGSSEAMRRIEALLRRVADIDSTLLLLGESGAGKEVAARFLHRVSSRAERPFVAVNCAAIPAPLLESELFGHEKGAFTGAHARHEGYAERARDGILFLDELSELPSPVQAKLLHLIQDRAFHRVGGTQPIAFVARLVCATNVDLEERVRSGHFRSDLFYRVNVIPVTIPPLRERREDIQPLLRAYVDSFAKAFPTKVRGIGAAAETAALDHAWPGNVRELRNRVERAVALATSAWIGPADLFPEQALEPTPEAGLPPLATIRDAAERRHIRAALERTGGQVKKAAALLGISRTTLWEKMRRLGLGDDAQA